VTRFSCRAILSKAGGFNGVETIGIEKTYVGRKGGARTRPKREIEDNGPERREGETIEEKEEVRIRTYVLQAARQTLRTDGKTSKDRRRLKSQFFFG
jgi:hypothetical protein